MSDLLKRISEHLEDVPDGPSPDQVFKGYEDIISNFWEIPEALDDVPESVKKSKFWTSEVVMLDTDEMRSTDEDNKLVKLVKGKNEVIKQIPVTGGKIDVLELSGDGGFNTFLVLKSDLPEVVDHYGPVTFYP